MKKKLLAALLALTMLCSLAACSGSARESIPYWKADSPAMASILDYVSSVSNQKSPDYVPPEGRIAVFDMDGTLYGERFPTYFDESLLLHRLLHDESYQAPAEDRAYAQALETALLNGEPEPDSDKSSAQLAAESFRGFTVEEYRSYVRDFMSENVVGFDGMTYGEGFYEPMVALVQYLSEHGFTVFISSGSERSLARELIAGTLDQWIAPYHVIGSTFTLTASGQGEEDGRKYTYEPKDEVLLEGNLSVKNQKTNKVFSIVDEIGTAPILVFGNSSGDISMAQYALQKGGRAYMLLCDDTQRDYGNLKEAEEFEKTCKEQNFESISMRDEFETIYGDDVKKTD